MQLKLFFCSAQEDKILADRLRKHLEPMERSGIITTWQDNDIHPGLEVEKEIRQNLDTADMILLLVSPDFVSSSYYGNELNETIKRHRNGSVFLILLRPCDWEAMFPKEILTQLKILPSNKKSVTQSRDRDLPLFYVVREIDQTVNFDNKLLIL
jgi:TIR domain